MMSDMKCPVCKGELHIFKSSTQDAIVCADCGFDGNTKLWQELIRTRKALDVAVDALKLMYQGNGDPQDIMRYKDNRWTSVRRLCMQALDKITALEQKGVK